MRSDAMPSDPNAPPTPNAAITIACSLGPPPARSLMANGTSTSIGPMISRISTDANSRVASSHGVRTM